MNLHFRALELVKQYQSVEAALVEVLRQIDDRRIYREHGAASLFVYATKVLGLTESVAWNFITVSRATKRSPTLKQAIQNGELSVSKARRITSVLSFENQAEWVEKAKTLSQRNLEKAVAKENPKTLAPERTSYVAENLIKLELGVSEQELEEIKYVQDLLSSFKQKSVSLKDAILETVRSFKARHDPLEKAKRAQKPDSSQVAQPESPAKGFTAAIVHEIAVRDQNQCRGTDPDGKRCASRRWLDIHHRVPRREGGSDDLVNLITLCRAHHQLAHARV